jgi:phenylpropionate dioxygenase-like ring-hydroxylating dioxygenase large terminal subunit
MTTLEEYRSQATYIPQLPAFWFNDSEIFKLEQEAIFSRSPSYVGHELMVPHKGDYFVLDWMKQSKALIHNHQGEFRMMSNICRHRQALILKGKGQVKRIICPLHRWVYDLNGKLEGTPYFEDRVCLDLESKGLQNWQGLLFDGKHQNVLDDLKSCKFSNYFDFSNYQFSNLEDYHVVPFHPGLGHFVDCRKLEWQFGANYSIQTVGLLDQLRRPGSQVYEAWHKEVLWAYDGKPPEYGAIWMTYYPSLTLEWYPNVLVVSNIIPTAPGKCSNIVEFYYPKHILADRPSFISAQQSAYMETAIEDQEICERMQQGREALSHAHQNEYGPYLKNLEDGLEHFNYWVKAQLNRSE